MFSLYFSSKLIFGEIYFIKHGKKQKAIASFSIQFSNIRDNKLIGEVIKYFKKGGKEIL